MAEQAKGSAWRIPAKHLPVLLPTLVRTQHTARTGPSTQEHGPGSSSCFCSSQWLGCFSPSAPQPAGLGTVGSGTGGNAATAASCLGTLQVCCRIWPGFPSSPLPSQLPLATGHCLLHVEKGGRRTAGFWSRGWVFCVMMRSCRRICRGYNLWWGSGGEHSLPQQTRHIFLAGGWRRGAQDQPGCFCLTKALTPVWHVSVLIRLRIQVRPRGWRQRSC